jgi:hypothetical protein
MAYVLSVQKAQRVEIAALTEFAWTDLYAYGPYAGRPEICAELKLAEDRCLAVAPEFVEEHQYFFVFLDSGRLVHFEHHDRVNGDFYEPRPKNPIKRERSRFLVTLVRHGEAIHQSVLLKHE